VNEKPKRAEQQNRRGRVVNLLLNVVVLLLGAGVCLTVEFGLQLLGQHFHI